MHFGYAGNNHNGSGTFYLVSTFVQLEIPDSQKMISFRPFAGTLARVGHGDTR